MSSQTVNAYAALKAKGSLEPYTFELPEIGSEEVEIKVAFCGICHSDLSMLNNDWGRTEYPFVPGHEIIGTVVKKGAFAQGVEVGDRVGLGWFSSSCMHCHQCISGSHHLCKDRGETIVGRFGGFADRVRCHWVWAVPLPRDLDASRAGPLFCGGITVFNPIIKAGVKPTDRVGVIGIGGLGHLALQLLHHWGCEVTAFTSSPAKAEQAKAFGAHTVIDSTDVSSMKEIAGTLDFILNTTNVSLNWEAYLDTLSPKGVLHTVGAVLEPMKIPAFSLIAEEKSVSGSPLGSPFAVRRMLDFCMRHNILPATEAFALEDVNDAFEHLKSGKARYRIVLKV